MVAPSSHIVLTCHGFTGYPEEMDPLGEFLEKQGFNWKNLQLPGHGTSPEDLRQTSWKDWASYVLSEIDQAQQEVSGKVFLIGLSLGGLLTLYALEESPNLAAGVTLAAPYTILRWYHFPLTLLPFGFWLENKDIADIHDPAMREIHRAYPKFHSSSALQVHKLATYVRKHLGKITKPILLIHSRKDKKVPVNHVYQIFNHVKSEDKRIFLVENSGHVLTRDVDRETIFNQILTFLYRQIE